MKTLVIFTLIFSSTLFAKPVFTPAELDDLSIEQRVQVLTVYRDFLREASEKFVTAKYSSMKFSFIEEAIAGANFDCVYAGWPSVSRSSGGKRLCSSPMNGNPDYRRKATECGANKLLCQPAIFGNDICVSVATTSERNSAFNQCESQFNQMGRTLAEVAAGINSSEKKSDLNDLVQDSESICRTGLQSQTALCNRLRDKLLAVKAEVEKTNGTVLANAATTAVRVTAGQNQPQVDCDPNTPGIQTVPPRVPQAPKPPVAPSRPLQRIYCSPSEIAPPSQMSNEQVQSVMRDYNINVTKGEATPQQLKEFVNEFVRFPAPLRDEMRSRGSRINLIVGNGVAEDPSWNEEMMRAPVERRNEWVTTPDGRAMNTIPGTGGSLGNPSNPTRLVINKIRDRGSVSLFLHEYAHTLDSMYSEHGITHSDLWKRTLASDPKASQFLQTICPNVTIPATATTAAKQVNYCENPDHPEEAFAELFAYYHACPNSRAQMQAYLPNVSRLMDRLTSVRDFLAGRIDLSAPPVPQAGAIMVADSSGAPAPKTAVLANNGVSAGTIAPGAQIPPSRQQIPVRGPGGSQSQSQSQSLITPTRALELVSSGGQLSYIGRANTVESNTVGSCLFSNNEVYVIIHACKKNGTEAPSLSIDIITKDGQRTSFSLENSEAQGLPSRARREQYDRNWRISYQKLDPPSSPFTAQAMVSYLQTAQNRISDNCTAGGVMMEEANAVCRNSMASEQRNWGPDAEQFWINPGDRWYEFVRQMRAKAQSVAGK